MVQCLFFVHKKKTSQTLPCPKSPQNPVSATWKFTALIASFSATQILSRTSTDLESRDRVSDAIQLLINIGIWNKYKWKKIDGLCNYILRKKQKNPHDVIFAMHWLLLQVVCFQKISWKPKIHIISSSVFLVWECHFTVVLKSHTAADNVSL